MDYDAAGQVVHLKRAIPSSSYTGEVSKQFDAAGRVTTQTYLGGDTIGPFAYDDAGRLTAIPGILTSVTYDAAGRPLVQTNANGTATTRQYNEQRGVLESLVTTGPGGTIQSLTYGYDPHLPLATSLQSPRTGESWTWGYDDGYRLTTATNPSSPADSQTFEYDSLGRITYNSRVGTYTYPLDGQPRPHAPTAAGGVSYQYDAVGNLYSGGGRTLTWDAENRIRTVGATEFTYDTFGERLKKKTGSNTSLYPFGDDYEITNAVTTRYVSVDGLGVIAKRVTGGSQAGLFWLHTDRLGSIQAVTDATGEKLHRDYRPYGETRTSTGTHTESRGWIDQRNDSETGLTYLHARYFDPRLGIFLSADPIGVKGGPTAYGYGLGDPINRTDRSGLASVFQCKATPPGGAGCGTNPSCVSPTVGVECWYAGEAETITVTAPGPPPDDKNGGDSGDGGQGEGYGQGNQGQGQGSGQGSGTCTGADCAAGEGNGEGDGDGDGNGDGDGDGVLLRDPCSTSFAGRFAHRSNCRGDSQEQCGGQVPTIASVVLAAVLHGSGGPNLCTGAGDVAWSQQLRYVLPDCVQDFRSPDESLLVHIDAKGRLAVLRQPEGKRLALYRLEPPAMVSWSPRSRAFFINDGEGSGMSSRLRLFHIIGGSATEDDAIEKIAVKLYRKRFGCGPAGENPDVWGFGWTPDGRGLHLLVQATVNDPCGEPGAFMGLTVRVADGSVVEELSPETMKSRFSELLPRNLFAR
jgi:RHS repeat-associated protein